MDENKKLEKNILEDEAVESVVGGHGGEHKKGGNTGNLCPECGGEIYYCYYNDSHSFCERCGATFEGSGGYYQG
ncbi:MAG: hypothetical protein ACI4F1_06790 [Bariatricus sp.]